MHLGSGAIPDLNALFCVQMVLLDLEDCFLTFERQQAKVKGFIGVLGSESLRESDPVSLTCHVGGKKLHLLVEEVQLLFLEDLTEVFIQGEEGGGYSGLGDEFVRHGCTSAICR
jgi:hypothetical protein